MHQHGNQGGVPPHGGHSSYGQQPHDAHAHAQAQQGYAHAHQDSGQHGYAHPGYAQQPQAAPGAPSPAPQRSKKTALGLAAGGIVAIGAVVAGVALMGGGPAPLPFDVARLPSDTAEVSVSSLGDQIAGSLGLRVDDLPEEAYWSALSAQACGGYDVFRSLMSAGAGDPKSAADALRRDASKYEKALSCGKALADEVGKNAGVYRVSFNKGKDERHSVMLLPLEVEELPATIDELESKSDPSNMTNTHCVFPWRSKDAEGDEPECGDRTPVLARLEGETIWVSGQLEDVKAFGSEYSPKGEHDDEKLRTMEALAKEVSSLPNRSYGLGEGFSLYGNGFLYVRASAEEKETKALKDAVEDDAVAWAIGGHDKLGYGEAKLVIVAKNDKRAKDIRSALADFVTSLKEQVEKAEEAEEKREKEEKKAKKKDKDRDETPEEIVEAMKAKLAMARRALADAELVQEGDRVVLTAKEVPTDDEKAAFERFYDWRKTQSVVVAKIVRGLLEGDKPDKAELDEIDEKIQKLLDSKWPHDPELATRGFYVPGGYGTDRIELGEKYLEFKIYEGLPRKDLVEILKEINKGWTIAKESGGEAGYKATKGGEELSILIGEKDGSATLLL